VSDKTEELFPFYGFGNYMKSEDALGAKLVFLFATDKETAARMLVEVVGSEGEVVTGSLRIAPGNNIRPDWLLAAAMGSEKADWSSGASIPVTQPAQEEELLN
jgi:hypothetical protein